MLLPDSEGALPSGAWPATVVAWGPGDLSTRHAHHAIHLIFARTGSLRVETDRSSASAVFGFYAPSNAFHSIDARDADVLLVFVDPQSELGAGLHEAMGSRSHAFQEEETKELLRDLPSEMEPDRVDAWLDGLFLRLGVSARRPRLHPGVARVRAHLSGGPAETGTSLETLSRVAGLSKSRLSHVFTEAMGLPLRTYLLWLRLLRAAEAIQRSESLTEAAHASGFSDAAHMSRTFRRMFGSTPSAMVDRSRSVQAKREQAKEE